MQMQNANAHANVNAHFNVNVSVNVEWKCQYSGNGNIMWVCIFVCMYAWNHSIQLLILLTLVCSIHGEG